MTFDACWLLWPAPPPPPSCQKAEVFRARLQSGCLWDRPPASMVALLKAKASLPLCPGLQQPALHRSLQHITLKHNACAGYACGQAAPWADPGGHRGTVQSAGRPAIVPRP